MKISQLTVVACGGYKKYLTKVQSYCNLIGRLAVTDDILRTTVLAQLKLIPNVRKIRDKVEEINDLVQTDDVQQASWDTTNIVNTILSLINQHKDAWDDEVKDNDSGMALFAGKPKHGKMHNTTMV